MAITRKRKSQSAASSSSSSSSSTAIIVAKPKPFIRRFNLYDLLRQSVPKNIEDKEAALERAEEVFVIELKNQLQLLLETDKDAPITVDANLQIKQKETFNAIAKLIEDTSAIEIDLRNFDFRPLGENNTLFESIAKSRVLSKLGLKGAKLSDSQLFTLFYLLAKHRNHASMSHFELDLTNLNLLSKTINLFSGLQWIETLQSLNLSYSSLTVEQFEELLKAVNNSALLHLNLSWASISGAGPTQLETLLDSFLKNNTTLISLNLYQLRNANHHFLSVVTSSMTQALANNSNSSLKEIEIHKMAHGLDFEFYLALLNKLRKVNFRGISTAQFQRSIHLNPNSLLASNLEHLAFDASFLNYLSFGEQHKLEKAISENRNITTLELLKDGGVPYNPGLERLINYLSCTQSIHTLILHGTSLGDKMTGKLIKILKTQNNSLYKLKMNWDLIQNPRLRESLKNLLKKNELIQTRVQYQSVVLRCAFASALFKPDVKPTTSVKKYPLLKEYKRTHKHPHALSVISLFKHEILPLLSDNPVPRKDVFKDLNNLLSKP